MSEHPKACWEANREKIEPAVRGPENKGDKPEPKHTEAAPVAPICTEA